MDAFVRLNGLVAPMDRINVDTDQIIPKQFLKQVEKAGFGLFAFFDWRYDAAGQLNPEFELNRPEYKGASILVAGRNFGSGSSREHAAWALKDFGFRVIIAPSFADIFFNNCAKNGMLLVTLPEADVRALLDSATTRPGYRLTVDLERQIVEDDQGFSRTFEIDAFRRHCLLNGLDDIGLTLQHAGDIAAFEAHRPSWLPKSVGAA